MRTIYNIKACCVIAFCGLTSLLHAQEENTNENALNREMTLEREYDPSVQDANKVNTLPVIKEPEVRKMPIDYASYAVPGDPEKEINVLPSGRIMTDILYNKRRGYFNFGAGTYLNMNGDLGYHILSTETDQLNLFFSHRSTNGGKVKYLNIDEKIKAKLNDNLGGLNYHHSFPRADLKLGIRYGYTGFNYYGMPIDPTYLVSSVPVDERYDRDTNQANQQIKLNFGIGSKEGEPLGYLFDIEYTNFSQKYSFSPEYDGITEHNAKAILGFNAPFGGTQLIGIQGQLNYFNYSTPVELEERFENYAEITVTPYYKAMGDNWNIKLGANVMFITGDNSKIFVSPNIAADVEVGNKTVLYLNADGEIKSNSAYSLSNINRYADPTARALPSRNWLDGEIGLKSGAAPGFWFNLFAGYKIIDDDLFFIQQPLYLNNEMQKFANVSTFQPLNSKAFKAGLALKFAYQKYLDIHLKGTYYNWNVSLKDDDEVPTNTFEWEAYGKPDFEFTAGLDIKPVDKVSLAFDYLMSSGRYAWYMNENVKMKNISELNFTGTYAINDTFGLYVKLNNLLFQKYELIYGYPLQKFGAMVGVNINF